MKNKFLNFIIATIIAAMGLTACATSGKTSGILVLQTDFGTKDGAVSAMYGVAKSVDKNLDIYDLTHEIPEYSIWDASYRLLQVIDYWPENTVFVSVVDPGVGSERKSIVAKTEDNKYIVTPDNGTITLIADKIKEARTIDETANRLGGSENSYTFHGRDVYAYTGARLASGVIAYDEVGPEYEEELVIFDYQAANCSDGAITGNIPILDVQYGNVWTNIDKTVADKLGMEIGAFYNVSITNNGKTVYNGKIPFCNTFSDVEEGEALLYYNSLNCLSIALNMDNFAQNHGISYGNDWNINISRQQQGTF